MPVENTIDQTATPIIEPVTAGDTTITGTAVAGSMVTVTVTGEEAVETEADEAGNWSVDVAEVSRDEIVTAVAQSEEEKPPVNQQRPLLMASRSTHLQRPLRVIPKKAIQ